MHALWHLQIGLQDLQRMLCSPAAESHISIMYMQRLTCIMCCLSHVQQGAQLHSACAQIAAVIGVRLPHQRGARAQAAVSKLLDASQQQAATGVDAPALGDRNAGSEHRCRDAGCYRSQAARALHHAATAKAML